MRTKISILCGVLIAAPLLHAAGSENSRFYLTPSAEYMFMGDGPKMNRSYSYPLNEIKFKNAAGLSLEGGFNLTANHIIKLETGFFKAEASPVNYPSYIFPYGTSTTTAKMELIPVLLGYKYRHQINKNWQFYIGVSEGVTIVRTRVTDSYPGFTIPPSGGAPGATFMPYSFSARDTDRAFTYGGELGVEYAFNERSELNLGAKCRSIDKTQMTNRGVTTSINLGYKFKF